MLDTVIGVYVLACRERKYNNGYPLPLSTSDITAVVNVRPVDIPRWLLDDIIFEIDTLELNEVKRLQKAK